MTWIVKHKLFAAAIVAIVVYLWSRKSTAAAGAPVVPGEVTSGGKSLEIDTNVLSDTFGLPIYRLY